MSETATIYQCPDCLRLFNAAGEWLAHPMRAFVPESQGCGAADCAEVTGALQQRERERVARRMERRKRGNVEPRTSNVERRTSNIEHRTSNVQRPRPGRQPFKENDEDLRRPAPVAVEAREVVTAREFGQEDYLASGAADSQNEKLLEFFRKPNNFGRWFKATLLEDLSGARRMNNRAVDLRRMVQPEGLWIDNCMIRDEHSDVMSSCYRICKISEALCLTPAKKRS